MEYLDAPPLPEIIHVLTDEDVLEDIMIGKQLRERGPQRTPWSRPLVFREGLCKDQFIWLN